MNPVFVILVLLAGLILWFLLSFVFYPIGRLIYRIFKDAIDEINRDDDLNNKDKKEN